MEKHKGHTMTYEGKGRFYCINCKKVIGRGVDKLEQKPRWVLNENILYVMGRQDLEGGDLLLLYDTVGIKYAVIDTGLGYINYTKSVGYAITQEMPYVGLRELRLRTNNLDVSMEELQIRGSNAVLSGQVGQLRAKYNNNSVYFMKGYEQALKIKCKDGETRTIYKIKDGIMNIGPMSKEDNRTMNKSVESLKQQIDKVWVAGKQE